MNDHPAIVEIKKQLEGYSNVPIVQKKNTLFVEPKDSKGFRVWLKDNSKEFVVFCDRWSYDQFFENDHEKAAILFLFALTASARLRVREKKQKRYWWLLESCVNGEWGGIEVTYRPGDYSLWGKKHEYYLQNDWVDIDNFKPWIGEQFTAERSV